MSNEHFADRLLDACRQKGAPVCVGIDPVMQRLPQSLHKLPPLKAIEQYVTGLLTAVVEHVPCVKFQSACFERYHAPGVALYEKLVEQARVLDLIVIGDAKRGDIGVSAEHYAAGCLADDEPARGPDALTINSYLGLDSMRPFTDLSITQHKGLFALVRTSNPGGDEIQGLALADGRTVAEAVAQLVAELGECSVGRSGYSLLGAVVGATKPRDAVRLRELMPRQIFLVPGFGAQGGSADDVRACFNDDGRGALITASRSVIFAYEKQEGDWQATVTEAAKDFARQIREIVKSVKA